MRDISELLARANVQPLTERQQSLIGLGDKLGHWPCRLLLEQRRLVRRRQTQSTCQKLHSLVQTQEALVNDRLHEHTERRLLGWATSEPCRREQLAEIRRSLREAEAETETETQTCSCEQGDAPYFRTFDLDADDGDDASVRDCSSLFTL